MWYDRTPTYLGSSLLLVPDVEYTLRMDFSALKDDGTMAYGFSEVPLKLGGDDSFEKGKEYVIQVAVYGIQQIAIKANLPGWNDSHKPIPVDPDEDGYTEF
jgi:hypothetical protein